MISKWSCVDILEPLTYNIMYILSNVKGKDSSARAEAPVHPRGFTPGMNGGRLYKRYVASCFEFLIREGHLTIKIVVVNH